MSRAHRRLHVVSPSASPAQAAAIVAAVGRFMRDTAPALATAPAGATGDPWLRAAMLEGVYRHGPDDEPEPWLRSLG